MNYKKFQGYLIIAKQKKNKTINKKTLEGII